VRHAIVAAALAAALLGAFTVGYHLGAARHPAVENVRVVNLPPVAKLPPAVQPHPRELVRNLPDMDVAPLRAAIQPPELLPMPTPVQPPRLIRILRPTPQDLLAPPYPSPWPPPGPLDGAD
jgi:hypothetical protein